MTRNQPDSDDRPLSKNRKSGDPGDGSNKPAILGRAREKSPAEHPPKGEDKTAIETFEEEGAGIAAKE